MEINGLRLECLLKERNLKLFSSKHAINSSFHFIRANVTSGIFSFSRILINEAISCDFFIEFHSYPLCFKTFHVWWMGFANKKTEISSEKIESGKFRYEYLEAWFLSECSHCRVEKLGWTFNNEG